MVFLSKTVTVVVPVYNGAAYIEHCADYLRAQTFDDFDVIFSVDVRSDDGSVELAQKTADAMGNATVVLQEDDMHLAGARNNGLRAATGRFIWFCDVDDAPCSEFLAEMVAKQAESGAQMVVCAFLNVGPEGCIPEGKKGDWHSCVYNRDEAARAIACDQIPVSTWTKLFDRQFLIDNDLFFDDSFAEDIVHTFKVLDKVTTVCVYDRPLYAYRLTQNSICRTAEHRAKRTNAELEAYRRADAVWKDDPNAAEILKHNARLRMRSSGHMDLAGFLEYQKSDEAREGYEKYFKGTPEGMLYRYLPRIYYYTEQAYFKLVYKRKGSRGMRKLRKKK